MNFDKTLKKSIIADFFNIYTSSTKKTLFKYETFLGN